MIALAQEYLSELKEKNVKTTYLHECGDYPFPNESTLNSCCIQLTIPLLGHPLFVDVLAGQDDSARWIVVS